MIHEFRGTGPLQRPAVDKLNVIVGVANQVDGIRGDDVFINFIKTGNGVTAVLNIQKVLERVPKPPSSQNICLFPVITKRAGTVTPPYYDLYDQVDTGYSLTLNQSGSISPTCSAVRRIGAGSLTITAAPDGSVASAYLDASGVIQIFDLPETVCGSV